MVFLHSKPPFVAANSVDESRPRDIGPVILTKREAANYVRCTPRYIERQIRAGRLKALKPTGKLVRIRRTDLDAFLESGATIGGDK
jgi:excisionase family DNA binding protein